MAPFKGKAVEVWMSDVEQTRNILKLEGELKALRVEYGRTRGIVDLLVEALIDHYHGPHGETVVGASTITTEDFKK